MSAVSTYVKVLLQILYLQIFASLIIVASDLRFEYILFMQELILV